MKILSLPQFKDNGIMLYSGPSNIDQQPIMALAVSLDKSMNEKTGNMVQIYILNKSIKPAVAVKEGLDNSICGDCKHRSKTSGGLGTCYVNVAQGPSSIFNALNRNPDNYPMATEEYIRYIFKDRLVRFGSYGDPAAIPMKIWRPILDVCKGHTAYTHQWTKTFAQEYKEFCMASVDTPKEYLKAKELGWRTFRVRLENEKLMQHEFECPASKEQNHRLSCQDCLACSGGNSKAGVAIIVHGMKGKVRKFIKIRKLQISKKKYTHLLNTTRR